MSTAPDTPNELRIAEAIVSVLPAEAVMRVCCDDRRTIRYAVRGEGLKLREIVLCRSSLRRLADDPVGAIKIEYLQRDLARSARRRAQFRYPREIRRVSKTGALPLAALRPSKAAASAQ